MNTQWVMCYLGARAVEFRFEMPISKWNSCHWRNPSLDTSAVVEILQPRQRNAGFGATGGLPLLML